MPKAAVVRELNLPLTVEDLDLDSPKAGEIKIRLGASGVCHSDLSIQNGTMPMAFPMVLGHEGAGVVEEVGEGVDSLKVGDHVVVSWVPQCGVCFYCTRGQGHMCESGMLGMMTGGLPDGTKRWHKGDEEIGQMACTGVFAEEAVITATAAVRVDDDIPLEIAALIGCGVLTGVGAALNTADIAEGGSVAVIGCGGVGLNVIQGAKIAGAETIIAVDMLPGKLEMATAFGATHTVNPADGDPVGKVKDLTENRGVDSAFEVIGLKKTIAQVVDMARRGGEVVLVGVAPPDVMLEVPATFGMLVNSKTIKGCWYGSSNVQTDVPRLLGYYKEGKLKLDELISRRIKLDEVNDAFDALQT
ncbi:MAG: Zn-dependent alcohol dehydrogenase, partial [Acidimicrobiales bacterium]